MNRPSLSLPAAMAVVAIVVSAACRSPEPTPVATDVVATDGPSACELLTSEAVADAVGQPVVDGVAGEANCTFGRLPNEAGYSDPLVTIRLEYGATDPRTLLDTYQATLRSALGDYAPQAVDDVGDAAAWDGEALAATFEVSPDQSAFVSVQVTDPAMSLDAGRAAATALVIRAIAVIKRQGLASLYTQ